MNDIEILQYKKSESALLRRNDLVDEIDSADWRARHPTGPVHVDVVCKLCGLTLLSDLKEYGHTHNDSVWENKLIPHFADKHMTD